MPTYGYHCSRCQTEFEVLQRMTDEPGAACPTCGGPGRRLFFPAGIVFKGSGFYKTDSRKASAGSVSGSGGAKKKETGSGDKVGTGDKAAAGASGAGSGSGGAAGPAGSAALGE